MPNYGVPGTIGLSPDAPALPGEWREASGLAFACLEAAEGRPADALLAALFRHHPRMHDGRSIDAGETARIDRVLTAPGARLPQMPMVETGEMGAALARTRETPAERRARIAALVPAGKVRGWVPAWKREEGRSAVGSRQSGSSGSAATVVPSDEFKRSGAGPDARETAADATCEAVTAGETALLSPERASETVGGFPVAAAPTSAEETGSQGGAANAAHGERRPSPPDATAGRDPHPDSAPAKPPRPKRVPSIGHIIAVAERHAGLKPGGLGLGRALSVTAARQVAMWLAFTLLQWDMARIGATFGRDRTTVRYALQTVAARSERDDAFAEALDGLVAEAKAEPRTRRRKIAP